MFSSIGWPEIFTIVVIGVIVIGPERLPGVIQDVRAAIYAARKAINNAKAELNGEFDSFGAEFEPLREPLSKAAEWGRLGPRGALTKALFDGDGSEWDAFNPKKSAQKSSDSEAAHAASPSASPEATTAGADAPSATNAAASPVSAHATRGFDYSQIYSEQQAQAEPAARPYQGMQPPRPGSRAQKPQQTEQERGAQGSAAGDGTGGGFSWADIT